MEIKKLRYSFYGCKPQDEYGHAKIEFSKGNYNHLTFLGEYDTIWEGNLELDNNLLSYIYDNKTKKIISSTFGLEIIDEKGKRK